MTEEASSTVGGTSSVGPSTAVISSCSTQDKALLKARLIQKHVQSKTTQQTLEINIKESPVFSKTEHRQSRTTSFYDRMETSQKNKLALSI